MNALIELAHDPSVQQLGWTLLHFAWQGSVIGAAFALVQCSLRKSSADVRYLSGCFALVLVLAAPMVTFTILHEREPSVKGLPKTPLMSVPVDVPASNVSNASPLFAAKQSEPSWHGDRGVKHREEILLLLVSVWLLGVVLLSCRLLINSVQVWRMKRLGNEPVGETYLQALSRLQQILGIDRSVALVKSALVEVPTLIGWLRPVILFPAGSLIGLAPAQVEAILAHELAHVRRYDYLTNLLQNIVETLLFYHPAVWWISHRVRIEREQCCDDLAVKVCGDRLGYAKALTALEELRSAPVALTLGADGGSLLTRIRRLYGVPTNSGPSNSQKAGGILAAAAVLAITVHLFADRPATEVGGVADKNHARSSGTNGLFLKSTTDAPKRQIKNGDLVIRYPLKRIGSPRAKWIALEDSPEPSVNGPYWITVRLETIPERPWVPVVALGTNIFVYEVGVSSEGERDLKLQVMNINDAMNPLELLDRAGKLFGLPRDQVLDERRKKVVPVPQFVEVTDAASGRTGEAKANAPTAVAARVVSKQDRYTVHAGGDLYVVFTNHPASNPVTTAFSRWQTVNFSNQPSGRQVAVFRLTNEENRSILLWNVRVEISSAGPTTEVSGLAGVHGGWEAVQNDYPHGGPNDSAIIEAGASGEFWVDSPPRAPWRVCVIYSKELIDDERQPPVSGRQHGGDFEVISASLPD